MKHPHSILLWQTNGELLAGGVPTRVVLSSIDTRWNDVVLEQHHFSSIELPNVMFKQHVIESTITAAGTNNCGYPK
jgi:hypothetical protein